MEPKGVVIQVPTLYISGELAYLLWLLLLKNVSLCMLDHPTCTQKGPLSNEEGQQREYCTWQ